MINFFKKKNRQSDFLSSSLTKQYHSNLSSSDIVVIINVWQRNYIEEQLRSIFEQTLKPCEIWILQCGDYISLKNIKKKYDFLQFVNSSINLKYFGRFSLAQFAKAKYVFILDDDVIPSRNWLENCKKLCLLENAIISSSGRIIPEYDFYPERVQNVTDYFIGDSNPLVPFNYCASNTIVDFGCNSWFFRSEWMKDFWKLPPYSFETGEDIHLSASCKILSGIKTIVPKQTDLNTTGNLKRMYGHDEFASWKKTDFLSQRSIIIKELIENEKWKPMLWNI